MPLVLIQLPWRCHSMMRSKERSLPGSTLLRPQPGVLLRREAHLPPAAAARRVVGLLPEAARPRVSVRDANRLAFGALWLFTLMLYARPNDLLPGLGTFPLVKIIALTAPLAYLGAQLQSGRPLLRWNTEVVMVCVLLALGILLTPLAASPKDSFDMLTDTFIKTVTIFVLLTGIVHSRERLHSLFKLVTVCGLILGLFAIRSYVRGDFATAGIRIKGLVGGMFENPNDLATALDLLIPLAILLGVRSRGAARVFYYVSTAVMIIGVQVTFSRGGFLGLLALAGVLFWKLGRGRRLRILLAGAILLALISVISPNNYFTRLTTIFNIQKDATGSAQERTELLNRALQLAVRRPVVGVGMGNFHIYSIREQEAHNSYLEIAAELGWLGLAAYLTLIFSALLGLRRVERETAGSESDNFRATWYFSVSLQAVFAAYLVCSFFSSIQYLWHLYYAAAYAVALRQIHHTEKAAISPSPPTASQGATGLLLRPVRPAGSLWSSSRAKSNSGNPAPRIDQPWRTNHDAAP